MSGVAVATNLMLIVTTQGFTVSGSMSVPGVLQVTGLINPIAFSSAFQISGNSTLFPPSSLRESTRLADGTSFCRTALIVEGLIQISPKDPNFFAIDRIGMFTTLCVV